jgi:chaperonin GroEL
MITFVAINLNLFKMIPKDVSLDKSGKEKLLNGINIFANAINTTLGAEGRTVLIEDNYGRPLATGDGYDVGQSIFLEDPTESLGCEMMKEGTDKVVNDAGDNTSTFTALAQALVNNSHIELDKSGQSANSIRDGLLKSKELVLAHLKKIAKPLTPELLRDVATTSCRGDKELANYVVDAFEKAGDYGTVSHTRSETEETYVDFIDGTLIESGFSHFEVFINDFPNQKAEWENANVLLSEMTFTTWEGIKPFVVHCQQTGKNPLVIISEVSNELRQLLAQNFIAFLQNKGGYPILVIDPPSSGSRRKDYLKDLGLIVGAEVITTTSGVDFSAVAGNYLGKCAKFTSTRNDSILVSDKSVDKNPSIGKLEELSAIVKSSNNHEEKKYLEDRIAKLNGKISIIKVGAGIESELKEKISRVEDAVKAVKSAKVDGVVAGGGIALLDAVQKCELDSVTEISLDAPLKKILENAGFDISVYNEIEGYPKGFDVVAKKEVDMFEAGIIDTVKGLSSAYSHAVSVAVTVLMTNTFITRKRQ